jgi:hypothetical protein
VAFACHGPQTLVEDRPQSVVTALAALTDISAPRDPMREASRFACEHFRPAPSSSSIPIRDIRRAYHAWCRRHGLDPLPDHVIGGALSNLFESVGLGRDEAGRIGGLTWTASLPCLS